MFEQEQIQQMVNSGVKVVGLETAASRQQATTRAWSGEGMSLIASATAYEFNYGLGRIFGNSQRFAEFEPDSLSAMRTGQDIANSTSALALAGAGVVSGLQAASAARLRAPSSLSRGLSAELQEGGSWLMTEEQYAVYGNRPMIGRPDGQFITSAKQMNQLISEAAGSPVRLGQALGNSEWGPSTKLIRMDVSDPLWFNPRLPSSRMSGANSQFVPGGFTSGGISEAAINPVPASHVWATPVR